MSLHPQAVSSGIALLLLFFTLLIETALPASPCTAPRELTRFQAKLPNTARVIRSHNALVIVAIGSSSTEGIGASDQAHAYPALLAGELQRHWPQLAITVLNKGVRGEIASEMLARFDRDVLAYHPQLVIWQTGSNHTLRNEKIDGYTDTVRAGISRLKTAKADVVLMDPQFAPRMLARPLHLTIADSLATVARDTNVALFRRFAVMQHWVSSGQYKFEEILSRDGLHMNDRSYGCIAALLAGSLVAATADSGTATAQRHIAVKAPAR
jgi:lysophospholipase L1-like esterase